MAEGEGGSCLYETELLPTVVLDDSDLARVNGNRSIQVHISEL